MQRLLPSFCLLVILTGGISFFIDKADAQFCRGQCGTPKGTAGGTR